MKNKDIKIFYTCLFDINITICNNTGNLVFTLLLILYTIYARDCYDFGRKSEFFLPRNLERIWWSEKPTHVKWMYRKSHILVVNFSSLLLNLLFSMILSNGFSLVNWLWFRTTYFHCLLQVVVHFLVESWCVKCMYRKSHILAVNFPSPDISMIPSQGFSLVNWLWFRTTYFPGCR